MVSRLLQSLKLSALLLISAAFLAACNPLDSKAKAGLQVETGEIPVSLFLDDQYLEKTPFINKEIKPGKYTLKIQPDDSSLTTYETEINLRKGLLTVVTWVPGKRPELSGGVIYEMERIQDKKMSELTMITIPDAAIVKIQDREKEFAPLIISPIDPGEKAYEVSLPSYDTQQHTVSLLPGYRTTITVKLAKSLYTPPSASASATPNPLATPLASASPTASVHPIASPNSSAIPSPSPRAATPKVAAPKVVIKSTNFFQNGQEVLRVRSSPTASGATLGYAAVAGEYRYGGETTNGWHKITFGGKVGWVSGQYSTLIQ